MVCRILHRETSLGYGSSKWENIQWKLKPSTPVFKQIVKILCQSPETPIMQSMKLLKYRFHVVLREKREIPVNTSAKQTNNQLCFHPATVSRCDKRLIFFVGCVCFHWNISILMVSCTKCVLSCVCCSILVSVIGKQSQIHFKSNFDLVNLEACQLVMGSERSTVETTHCLECS